MYYKIEFEHQNSVEERNVMLEKIKQWFVELWSIGRSIGKNESVDVIVPISYTTGRDSLVNATLCNLSVALSQQKRFSKAILAFSNCAYPFENAAKIESGLKHVIIRIHGQGEVIEALPMNNSVEEAENIKLRLQEINLFPSSILIVTGEMHSRSALYIWRKTFPNSKIHIVTIPLICEVQSDHPVLAQRSAWKWIISNILRQVALRVLPLDIVRKIQHQPAR